MQRQLRQTRMQRSETERRDARQRTRKCNGIRESTPRQAEALFGNVLVVHPQRPCHIRVTPQAGESHDRRLRYSSETRIAAQPFMLTAKVMTKPAHISWIISGVLTSNPLWSMWSGGSAFDGRTPLSVAQRWQNPEATPARTGVQRVAPGRYRLISLSR